MRRGAFPYDTSPLRKPKSISARRIRFPVIAPQASRRSRNYSAHNFPPLDISESENPYFQIKKKVYYKTKKNNQLFLKVEMPEFMAINCERIVLIIVLLILTLMLAIWIYYSRSNVKDI